MSTVAEGWGVKVDRGPDWVFVRLCCHDPHAPPFENLAEHVWSVMQQHMVSRLVLELDEVQVLPSYLIGQLVLLHKRLFASNGIMRLSGLSANNQAVLRASRLDGRFPCYRSREDAVMGHRPPQPR